MDAAGPERRGEPSVSGPSAVKMLVPLKRINRQSHDTRGQAVNDLTKKQGQIFLLDKFSRPERERESGGGRGRKKPSCMEMQ